MAATPRRDVLAGVTVGIVALPLALAFGITSGMGAGAGLVTAVIAGTLAALFGGSAVQISGPTGAMTVVLVPIIATFGGSGVLVVGMLAGLLLVLGALVGVGRYVRLIPLPVIEGFTLGIAVIIGLQQVPSALGQHARTGHVLTSALSAVKEWAAGPVFAPVAVAALTIVVMMVLGRSLPRLPAALLCVAIATALTASGLVAVPTIGLLHAGFPAPSLPAIPWGDLRALAAPALAVAALAALESLLSATVADAMTVDQRHDPDRELFGQGVANLVVPLFGGIPATAAIARTAVNVRSGAQSRLAAVVHSAVLLVVVLLLSPVVSRIPLAVLAGVLIATALRMVEISSLRALLRTTRSDAFVLAVTFVCTVALDLATAVILGLVAAGALALRQLARSSDLATEDLSHFEVDGEESVHSKEEQALLHEHIVAFRFTGPLFFGGAHVALLELAQLSDVKVVILRLSRLSSLDATGAAVLDQTITDLARRGVTVLLSGLPARFAPVLAASGLLARLDAARHLFADTPSAIAHARRHVARDGHHLTES